MYFEFFRRLEQVLTFNSVFMTLKSQKFSFSKHFYSFSAIFEWMLMPAILRKLFFIILMTRKIL